MNQGFMGQAFMDHGFMDQGLMNKGFMNKGLATLSGRSTSVFSAVDVLALCRCRIN
ncbi:MAG: Uncharacterised protein [Prochlorococcus marinus str. MIT 9215]|nr:MAG: Uncharacterised protein [Prochlorococcus marinus str. MIT 9215]